jgi:drug/metabolite transporter (DMT)-like permease
MIERSTQKYALVALASAALFGVSAPLAKILLGEMPAVQLAGLLYLGSGLGLLLVKLVRRASHHDHGTRLRGRDYGWLALAVLCGGVAGPVLLLRGLSDLPAAQASLLLNLEAVFTVIVAFAFFHEHVSLRVWIATLVMLGAGTLLAWTPGETISFSTPALAVAGACVAWALDNNLTRNISSGDPVSIAMIKGFAAGTVNMALAVALGTLAPALPARGAALMLGALSYGASLALYIVAQRHLGSARTGAHFATAPFIGAGVALLLLDEPVTAMFWVALALMAGATGLLVTERHVHRHRHERLAHEHPHVHDEHHHHVHAPGEEGSEPHSHPHVHEPMTHTHPHLPDLHHRHPH